MPKIESFLQKLQKSTSTEAPRLLLTYDAWGLAHPSTPPGVVTLPNCYNFQKRALWH